MFRLYSCPYLRGYFRPQLLLGSGPISRTSSPPCSSSEAGEVERVELSAVQAGALHVDVFARSVVGLDGKLFAAAVTFAEVDRHFFENRAGDFVNRIHAASAVGLEQTDRGHDRPCAHLSLILVAEVGVGDAVTVVAVEDRAAPGAGCSTACRRS